MNRFIFIHPISLNYYFQFQKLNCIVHQGISKNKLSLNFWGHTLSIKVRALFFLVMKCDTRRGSEFLEGIFVFFLVPTSLARNEMFVFANAFELKCLGVSLKSVVLVN